MFTVVSKLTRDFTFFSILFQSYQDDGQVIMKGCVQWDPFTIGNIYSIVRRGSNPDPLDQ